MGGGCSAGVTLADVCCIRSNSHKATGKGRWAAVVPPASPLQMFVAFPPIATALLDPFQAAIGVDCFVGFVLIGTSFEARLVGLLVGIGR